MTGRPGDRLDEACARFADAALSGDEQAARTAYVDALAVSQLRSARLEAETWAARELQRARDLPDVDAEPRGWSQ